MTDMAPRDQEIQRERAETAHERVERLRDELRKAIAREKTENQSA